MTATSVTTLDERRFVHVVAAAIAVFVAVVATRGFSGDELDVYRGAGRALLDGWDPYTGPLPGTSIAFSYTPFSTAVFVPLALVDRAVAFAALTLGSLACLWYVAGRVVDAVFDDVGNRTRLRVVAAAAAGLLVSEPVTQTLGLGQMNTLLVAMVLGDVLRARPSRWQGAWIGFATAFKLTPGIFIVYLLATRRFRAAATASATFATTIAAGFAIMPRGSMTYWFDGVGADPGHVGDVTFVANQSVLGALARVVGDAAARPWWLALVIPIFVSGTWLSVHVHRRWGDVAGLASIAFVGCLVSPYSWSHHFAWFVVPTLFLIRAAVRRGSPGRWLAAAMWTAPFLVGPFWWIPEAERRLDHVPLGRALLGATYTIQLLVGFAVVAWLVRRRSSGARHGDVADRQAREPVAAR